VKTSTAQIGDSKGTSKTRVLACVSSD